MGYVTIFRQTGLIVSHHFETSTPRLILSNHAVQIRSATCGNQIILFNLVEAGCNSLKRINYVLWDKSRRNSIEPLLETLMRLSLSDTDIAMSS
jgi:hypothetical protein